MLQAYKDDVYLGPKDLDEEVAEWHFPALGAELTVLTQVTQMSRLKTLSRASLTVIELQSPVEDFSTPTARITENWEKLLADRAHPQRPRTFRSSLHLRGLASPVEDGPNDNSPWWTKRL